MYCPLATKIILIAVQDPEIIEFALRYAKVSALGEYVDNLFYRQPVSIAN